MIINFATINNFSFFRTDSGKISYICNKIVTKAYGYTLPV